jgi:hypothetical protein
VTAQTSEKSRTVQIRQRHSHDKFHRRHAGRNCPAGPHRPALVGAMTCWGQEPARSGTGLMDSSSL